MVKDRKSGVLQSMGHKESNTTEQSNNNFIMWIYH